MKAKTMSIVFFSETAGLGKESESVRMTPSPPCFPCHLALVSACTPSQKLRHYVTCWIGRQTIPTLSISYPTYFPVSTDEVLKIPAVIISANQFIFIFEGKRRKTDSS